MVLAGQTPIAHKTIGAGPNAPTPIVLCASCYSSLRTWASSAFRLSLSIRKKPDSCGSMAVSFPSRDNKAASNAWKIASICCVSVAFEDGLVEDGIIEDGVVEDNVVETLP